MNNITIEQITPCDPNGNQIPIPTPQGHGYNKPFTIGFPEGCKVIGAKLHRSGIAFFAECRLHENPKGQRYENHTFVFLPNGSPVPKDETNGQWRHVETFLVDRHSDYVVHLYEQAPQKAKR